MEKIRKIIESLMPPDKFDALAVGVIDFRKKTFDTLEMIQTTQGPQTSKVSYFYDLASMTKVLTNSLSFFLKPEAFDEKLLACLSHRGGLPSWGLLPHKGWQKMILDYPVKEGETLYSDFSALRVMLELEKKGINQKQICSTVWDKEMMFWKDVPPVGPFLQYGYKNSMPNFGQVHDPNAWVLDTFCSHAGLFSTVQGACQTFLDYEAKTNFITLVKADLKKHSHRFALGWDRVENPSKTLAGLGCGQATFGHLGFTGTSIWIDPDKMSGQVILSNATRNYWHDKEAINEIRRAVGEAVWKNT